MPFLVLISISQIQDTDLENDVPVKIKQTPVCFSVDRKHQPSVTAPDFYCPYTVSQPAFLKTTHFMPPQINSTP